MKKVGVVSLGCPKNLVDSQIVLGEISKSSFVVTSNIEDANVIIVNTCGFIESAKEESINTILELAAYKNNKCEQLVVMGCLAQRYSKQIYENIPEVDFVIGVGGYKEVIKIIAKTSHDYNNILEESFNNNASVDYLNLERSTNDSIGYAYLKISEGCNNSCSYCIIPTIRGRYRSREIKEIVIEAARLVKSGVKELILVAQDVTRYGIDIYHANRLVELIRSLSIIEGVYGIRLLYCYPDQIDERLINEFKNNGKLLKYIDIPIQHASDKMLKLMNRIGDSKLIKECIKSLRTAVPEITIRTTLIVGFPGETEEDFEILKNFVAEQRFEKLGVFEYSKEEGTKAFKMKNQINKKIKKQRRLEILKIQDDIDLEFLNHRIGKKYKVLVEGIAEDGIFYYGRSYCESPEIDSYLLFTSQEELKVGNIYNVRILTNQNMELIGEILNEFGE